MENLRRERTVLRQCFSRAANELRSKMETETDNTELCIAFNCLKAQADKLWEVQDRLKKEWLTIDNFDEFAFETDYEASQAYEHTWIELSTRYDILMRSNNVRPSTSITIRQHRIQYVTSNNISASDDYSKKKKIWFPRIQARRLRRQNKEFTDL